MSALDRECARCKNHLKLVFTGAALFARPPVLAADGPLGACQVQQPRVAAHRRVEAACGCGTLDITSSWGWWEIYLRGRRCPQGQGWPPHPCVACLDPQRASGNYVGAVSRTRGSLTSPDTCTASVRPDARLGLDRILTLKDTGSETESMSKAVGERACGLHGFCRSSAAGSSAAASAECGGVNLALDSLIPVDLLLQADGVGPY